MGYGYSGPDRELDDMREAFNSIPDITKAPASDVPELDDTTLDEGSSGETIRQAEKLGKSVSEKVYLNEYMKSEPKETFGQAFKRHRKAHLQDGGPDTFDFKGTKYTVKLKEEARKPKSAKKNADAPSNPAPGAELGKPTVQDEIKASVSERAGRDDAVRAIATQPKRPGIMARMREKDKEITGIIEDEQESPKGADYMLPESFVSKKPQRLQAGQSASRD